VKLITKIAAIAAVSAAGITAASAQMAGPYGPYGPSAPVMAAPYGAPYGEPGPAGGWNDPSDYRSGFSGTNMWATPGTQEQRDIAAQGNG
jgi:hypothetical protein